MSMREPWDEGETPDMRQQLRLTLADIRWGGAGGA